jgi:hypothetical protein
MRFTNPNNYRYCELFLIGGDAVTKDLQAEFYNSTDPSGGADFAARMSHQVPARDEPAGTPARRVTRPRPWWPDTSAP